MNELDTSQDATTPPKIQEELVITLLKPIKLASLEYFEITLTEPTMGQLRRASKAGTALDQLALLISENAGIPQPAVDRMLKRDIDRAGDFFGQFENAIP
jgi:hypothetical protein